MRVVPAAMKNRARAALFDCDGLLVATEALFTTAETQIFASHGATFTPAHKQQLLGQSLPEVGRRMASMLGLPGDGEAIADELQSQMEDLVSQPLEPLPGVRELLDSFDGRLTRIVVSNSPRRLVAATLRSAGLHDRFDAVITVEGVQRPKPFPDLYMRGVTTAGVAPTECIAFEDSATGVSAARAAGVPVIRVPSHPGGAIGADWHVRSLASLAARALLVQLTYAVRQPDALEPGVHRV